MRRTSRGAWAATLALMCACTLDTNPAGLKGSTFSRAAEAHGSTGAPQRVRDGVAGASEATAGADARESADEPGAAIGVAAGRGAGGMNASLAGAVAPPAAMAEPSPAGGSGPTRSARSCAPQCELRSCGADGCGGSCGSCVNASACVEGLCIQPAQSGAGRSRESDSPPGRNGNGRGNQDADTSSGGADDAESEDRGSESDEDDDSDEGDDD